MAKTTVRGLKGRKQVYHAVYDFIKDGGLNGSGSAIEMFNLKAGTIVHNFWVEVESAVVGTSSTIELGDSGDTDGIFAQEVEATLVDNFVSGTGEEGAYLSGGLRKKFTADTTLSQIIGTADLSAGKLHYYLECSDGY